MKNRIIAACVVVCLLPLSSHATTEVRASKLILDSYRFQCPKVYTPEVGVSVENLQTMGSILEELKADTACGGSNQLSSILAKYSAVYSDFQSRQTDSLSKTSLEQKISHYTLLLADPSIDPNLKIQLQQELVTAQSSLISINANLQHFSTFSGQEAKVANQLLLSVNHYMTNLEQNPQCMQKKGLKVASLVSGALVTTAAFATGGTALALAAGSVIVQSTAVYLKDKKSNVALDDIESLETPLALRCMSQVLTDQYCQSAETKRLLEERKNSNEEDGPMPSTLEGLNLLSYQMSGLSKWLEEIYSGSRINSQGDLINRSKPSEQAHLLKNINDLVQATTAPRMETINNIENASEKSGAIIKLIEIISDIMRAERSDVENPLLTSLSPSLMPFELFEPGKHSTIPTCEGNDKCSFRDYVAKTVPGGTLKVNDMLRVIENAFKLIEKSKSQVSLELNKKVSLDAYTVLVNANRDLNGEVNALQALIKIKKNAEKISTNLKSIGCSQSPEDCETPLNPYYPQYTNVLKTKDLVENVIALIRESFQPRSLPEEILPKECRNQSTSIRNFVSVPEDEREVKSFQVISCISKILKIQERGNSVFFTKVRDMVSYDIEARLKNNTLGDAVTSVVSNTRGDLVATILNSYRSNENALSLEEVIIGLETAQNNTLKMMELFADFFERDFKKSLRSNKLASSERNDLCIRSLPFLSENNQDLLRVSYDVCKDVKFQFYKNGPKVAFADYVQPTDGKNLFNKSKMKLKGTRESRLCSYRSYSQKITAMDEQKAKQAKRNILENGVRMGRR